MSWPTLVCVIVFGCTALAAQRLPATHMPWYPLAYTPLGTTGTKKIARGVTQSATSIELRQLLADVRPGKYLFNPPSNMRLGETDDIEFRLAERASEALLVELKGRGKPIIGDIQIGTYMTAKLIGDPQDFTITAFSTERQFVAETASWRWKVTPLRSGKHTLRLLATIRIKIPNSEEERDYLVKDEEIEIPIDRFYELKRFLLTNGSWVWPLIVTLLLGGPALEWWSPKIKTVVALIGSVKKKATAHTSNPTGETRPEPSKAEQPERPPEA